MVVFEIQEKDFARWYLKMNSRLALAGLSIASFLGCIDLTGMSTILPSVQKTLNVDFCSLQWVNSIVFIALACSTSIVGKLSDIYGKKQILYAGMLIIALSSLGAGLSTSIYSLIFFRFLQGISIAVFYTVPIALLSVILSEHKVAKATGFIIGINGVGLAIGPVLGGAISQYAGWQWIFFINIPLIFISYLFCKFRLLHPEEKQPGTLNISRSVFFMLLVFMLIILINGSFSDIFSENTTLKAVYFILTVFLAISFFFADKNSNTPIINYNNFRKGDFLLGVIANMILAFSYSILLFMVPQYLKRILGLPDNLIGLFMLSVTLTMALCSFLTGKFLERRTPPIKLILTGFVCLFLCLVIQEGFSYSINITLIFISLVLFGAGWGLILTPSIVISMLSVREHEKGSSMGTLVTLHNLSAAISLSCGTYIYNSLHHRYLNQHTDQLLSIQNVKLEAFIYGYQGVMNVLAIGMVIIVVITTFIAAISTPK